MSNRLRLSVAAAVLLFYSCGSIYGGSIWAKRGAGVVSFYADNIAGKTGDILTIIISEVSTVENIAKRKLEKKTKRSQQFNGKTGFNIEHILPEIPSINFGAGTEYISKLDGKAEYIDEREFTDRITVVVEDVMPNGNLVISGTRYRAIAGDTQIIEVSGIVRPNDIQPNNTIKSELIANFRIVTKTSGIAESFTKPGWLGSIFDFIWPF